MLYFVGWQRWLGIQPPNFIFFYDVFRRLFILLFALNNVLLAGLKKFGLISAGNLHFILEVVWKLFLVVSFGGSTLKLCNGREKIPRSLGCMARDLPINFDPNVKTTIIR